MDPKQTENIKKKIIEQIDKSFPDDKKEFAKKQIEIMNSEELEKFLNQNRLIKTHQKSSECVFCSITSGNISSHKIDENSKAIAVLEINPYSKGHVLVIPKEHISSSDKIPASVFSLVKKISKKIKTKLKPKNIKIDSSNLFGHEIINIIPIYDDNLSSERLSITQEELSTLKEILTKTPGKTVKKVIKLKPEKSQKPREKIILPKRIP